MPFGADSIGFWLDIDAAPMRKGFRDALTAYTDFNRQLERANKKAITGVQSTLDRLGKAAQVFASLPKDAVLAYDKALTEVQRRVKPIKQPIEFVFTGKGGKGAGGGFEQVVSRAVSDAMGKAQFRLTPALPSKRNRMFEQASSLQSVYKRMPQPPDYVGTVRMPKYQTGTGPGGVKGPPGSPRYGDGVMVRLNPGEHVTPGGFADTMLTLLESMNDKLSERERSKAADITKTVLGNHPALLANLAGLSNLQKVMGRMSDLKSIGVNVSQQQAADVYGRFEARRGSLANVVSGLNAEEIAHIAPLLKQVQDSLDSSADSIKEMAEQGSKMRRSGFVEYITKLGKTLTSPMGFMAVNTALREMRGVMGAVSNVAGQAPHTQEQFARMFAQTGGTMQQGRSIISRAFGQSAFGTRDEDIAGAAYGLRRAGFRTSELNSPLTAAIAMAARAGGADPSALATSMASLRRSGVGAGNSTVAVARLLRASQGLNISLGDLTGLADSANIGRNLATAARTRGLSGGQAGRVFTGLTEFGGRLFAAGGRDAMAAQSSTDFMSLFSEAASGDVQAQRSLAMLGINRQTMLGAAQSGDMSGVYASARGQASKLQQLSPEALRSYAGTLGMDVHALRAFIDSVTKVDMSSFGKEIVSVGDAMAELREAVARSTNAADKVGSGFEGFGAWLNKITHGGLAAAGEMPWTAMASVGFLGNMVTGGRLGSMGGRGLGALGSMVGRIGGRIGSAFAPGVAVPGVAGGAASYLGAGRFGALSRSFGTLGRLGMRGIPIAGALAGSALNYADVLQASRMQGDSSLWAHTKAAGFGILPTAAGATLGGMGLLSGGIGGSLVAGGGLMAGAVGGSLASLAAAPGVALYALQAGQAARQNQLADKNAYERLAAFTTGGTDLISTGWAPGSAGFSEKRANAYSRLINSMGGNLVDKTRTDWALERQQQGIDAYTTWAKSAGIDAQTIAGVTSQLSGVNVTGDADAANAQWKQILSDATMSALDKVNDGGGDYEEKSLGYQRIMAEALTSIASSQTSGPTAARPAAVAGPGSGRSAMTGGR